MRTHGHYVGPVILASEQETAQKTRVIEIIKSEVYKDIDLFTHKHVDGNDTFSSPYSNKQILYSPQTQNARSSDTSEGVDGAVVARYVEYRDSQMRLFLDFALVPHESVELADDNLDLQKSKYVYTLVVPDGFNDNMLRPLAEQMHRYLVCGALFDWYNQFGMERQAASYGSQLQSLEDSISGALRGPSIVKRPLQPFGPAEKMF